jgi:starch synthase
MKIGIVASEAIPFSKTGGLADVAGSLFEVFHNLGHDTFLFLPYYKTTKSKIANPMNIANMKQEIGEKLVDGKILTVEVSKGRTLILIEQDDYYNRDNLYGTKDGDYQDNSERFGFFDIAVVEAIKQLNLKLDILHLNDWQTGLIPLLLKEKGISVKTLFTIHNLAYQGNFPSETLKLLHIDEKYFNINGLEFYGKVSFIKAGIIYSDYVNTVSPTYAKEILTPEFGENLDGILNMRKDNLTGIINGIDYKIWNSKIDKNIFKNYDLKTLQDKELNKKKLYEQLIIKPSNSPLFGMVSRIATQKGLDILIDALVEFLHNDIRIIILGTGEKGLEETLKRIESEFPEKFKAIIGFDDVLAHRIYAASDFFLMPSKYEPCGLGQLISLKYGTIPIVRATGGLKDTIDDYNSYTQCGNGLSFSEYSSNELLNSLNKALIIYSDPHTIDKIRKIAMNCDFSWENSAKDYIKLYERIEKKS